MTADPLLKFLSQCSEQISALAHSTELQSGAVAFAACLESIEYLPSDQAQPYDGEDRIPVASSCLAGMGSSPLGAAVQPARDCLPWIPSHRMTDGGTEAALAPLNHILDFDTHGVTAGLLLVGPGYQYPLHNHPPQELYLTISGTGDWRFGGADGLVSVAAGQLLYNHPNDLHQLVAGDEAVLALYVLW